MRLIIRNENSELSGVVGFGHGFVFFGKTDSKLKTTIKNLEQAGIPMLARKVEDKNITYIKEIIINTSPTALFALREYLKSIGYSVDDYHEEAVAELKKILESYENCEEKDDLLKRVPAMSYLQQTTLLQEFKSQIT